MLMTHIQWTVALTTPYVLPHAVGPVPGTCLAGTPSIFTINLVNQIKQQIIMGDFAEQLNTNTNTTTPPISTH